MELHPFLDNNVRPSSHWWYVLPVVGESPSMRVGHSATLVPALHANEGDKVFVIGGANPGQIFTEVHILDLKARTWDTLEATGFRGRYEHAAFCVSNHPGQLFVFGGATQTGSLNDVQKLDTGSGTWTDVEIRGTPPSPRTHRSSVVIGSKVYFYSGGHSGPDPVGDRRVHCLDTATISWSTLAPAGDSPKPRHGHVMVALKNKIYLHGGMAGSTFYDDLFILDLDRNSWSAVKKKKTSPPARAAHEAVIINKELILFGGMNKVGALDDAFKFNTETSTWSKLEFEGPAPPNRLDFAMCAIKLSVPVACAQSPAGTEPDLSNTSMQVKQVLERELKPGSASSRDSLSDNSSSDPHGIDKTRGAPPYSKAQCNMRQKEQLLQSTKTSHKSQNGTQEHHIGSEQCQVGGGDCNDKAQSIEREEIALILINGGMDTEGEIFDDTLVLCL
ncbi:unnamed protein product [Lymnaea stagnalis]|uniref:Rab9 effector protein with kelch motifs n=1 Tax=Lymnaea stagnalis TaxID=6523 RepID=A0AAV2H7K8_LYMST